MLKVRGKNKHNHWISISISPSGAIFDFHWEKKTSFQHWFWHVYSHKFKVLSLVYQDLVTRYTYGSHKHHTIYELDLCMGQHFSSLSVTCLWSCIFFRLHACWRVCMCVCRVLNFEKLKKLLQFENSKNYFYFCQMKFNRFTLDLCWSDRSKFYLARVTSAF